MNEKYHKDLTPLEQAADTGREDSGKAMYGREDVEVISSPTPHTEAIEVIRNTQPSIPDPVMPSIMPSVIPPDRSQRNMGIWGNIEQYETALRMAKALSQSTVIPKDYQGNIANCLIALDTAARINISPFATMQNLYIVNGRPSWSSQFISAIINTSGRFLEPLKFHFSGTGEDRECYAWTRDLTGCPVNGPAISMKMAKEEGWSTKTGSKWRTMPDVMLQYRATSFFGRLNCSDLIMGIYSADEMSEIGSGKDDIKPHIPDIFGGNES